MILLMFYEPRTQRNILFSSTFQITLLKMLVLNKCGGNLQLIQCSASAAAWKKNSTSGGKLAGSRQG